MRFIEENEKSSLDGILIFVPVLVSAMLVPCFGLENEASSGLARNGW